jgi:hypothetical protein
MSINADNIIGTYDIYSKQYILTFTEKPTLIESTDCSFQISIIPEFECAYSGLSIPDGIVGDTVTATVTEGTIGTITPSAYQQGLTDYSVQITAPGGYTNAGTIILCPASATGTPTFGCSDAALSINNGNVGATVTGTVSLGTIVSFTPSTYVSGSTQYFAKITVPSGYSNTGDTEFGCSGSATGINPPPPPTPPTPPAPTPPPTPAPCTSRITSSSIPAQTLTQGQTVTINLNSYFTQLDGLSLSYSVNAAQAINFYGLLSSATISGSTLTMVANNNNVCSPTSSVQITADDGVSGNCIGVGNIGITVTGCSGPTPPTPPTPPPPTPPTPTPPTPTPPAPTPSLYYTFNACDPSLAAVDVQLASQPANNARYVRSSDMTFWTYDNNAGTSTATNPTASLNFTSNTGCP